MRLLSDFCGPRSSAKEIFVACRTLRHCREALHNETFRHLLPLKDALYAFDAALVQQTLPWLQVLLDRSRPFGTSPSAAFDMWRLIMPDSRASGCVVKPLSDIAQAHAQNLAADADPLVGHEGGIVPNDFLTYHASWSLTDDSLL